MSHPSSHAPSHTSADRHHGDDHHDHGGFWSTYVFSTDHKVIGIQYGVASLAFLFIGFLLMLAMRWQMAYNGKSRFRWSGALLESTLGPVAAGGVMTPDLYNAFGAMHGTIMVFLGVVPLGFAAFGNYLVPLQIGAPDMAFPRINMASFWAFLIGGMIMMVSFFIPGGAARAGGRPTPRWPRPFPPTARRGGSSAWSS
jgi:cytochrome c oxidase subunit 1